MNSLSARLLNGITMYRLMLYYLGAMLVVGLALGFTGRIFLAPFALIFSLVVLTVACWGTNRIFAALLHIPVNRESALITALILALVMPPAAPTDLMGIAALVLAALVAIGSKFLLTVGHKHIFNPVAIGAVAAGVALGRPAVWWVSSSPIMLVVVVLGGLLVTQKVRRFDMIAAYVLSNLAVTVLATPPGMMPIALQQSLLYSPLFFAGFVMLTEPMTAAHGRYSRLVYGVIVGLLSAHGIHIGHFFFSPEAAFLVGNLFAWSVSPKGRFRMTLLKIEQIAAECQEFVFRSDRSLNFVAGQYLDWTLQVPAQDNRGNRRSFTIASAPGEDHVRLGVKFYPEPSAFKRQLSSMQPGDVIFGSQIAGNFTLPRDPERKLLFIAGGIGITPFRSMIQHLLNRHQTRDAILLYGNRHAADIAYGDLLERAGREIGLCTKHVISDDPPELHNHLSGFIDSELLQREVPDLGERTIYVSGPQLMVTNLRRELSACGIPRRQIKTDFFPGF
ncbi:MAG: hypothetical protein GC146_09795 [Limimaricola sp.]|uniref:FAD-binding oxidoreductase n=1 Tax=Limimaricola sp. TaxID=2211665 RepID=UPI001DCC5152|nr:FAD-binding oxidoreductase [Limimaricola sp.]MBI1417500.1 hypothetical protein [Limimaricola sp.]